MVLNQRLWKQGIGPFCKTNELSQKDWVLHGNEEYIYTISQKTVQKTTSSGITYSNKQISL